MMSDAKVCISFAFIEGDMFTKTWGAVEEGCCLTSVTFEFVSINPKNKTQLLPLCHDTPSTLTYRSFVAHLYRDLSQILIRAAS